jgi:hypothetical protein
MRQQRWLELIKDYALEVHYHPGKANVVAYALSRKHRCNHLTIQSHPSCCDPEEPCLVVVPHGRLTDIALIPTFKEDVITAQKTGVEMGISEEGWSWVKHSVSDKMPMEFYFARIVLWCQRTLSFTARSWMRLIVLDTLSIQEPTRCIKTCRRVSGG